MLWTRFKTCYPGGYSDLIAPEGAHVVEEILLGVAGVRAEVAVRKLQKTLLSGTAFREIKLPQCFHHPNVDGKSLLKSVGEEQHAIGNFVSYSRQPAQFFSRLIGGHIGDEFEI